MSATNNLPPITLDELERLIRILGMLGSVADGEVLAAAKFARKWVVEHQTDWRTLLTPPEEPLPVTGVGTGTDQAVLDALERAAEADRVQAYANGYQAGMRDMAAQLKAQGAAAAGFAQVGPGVFQPTPGWIGAAASGLGGGLGGLGPQHPTQQGPAPGRSQAAPGGVPGGVPWGTPGVGQHHQGNPWPPGSWKAVAWELLERQRQGIPGIFRNANEESFVQDVLRRGFPTLTSAQEKWLRDIAGRSGMSW